MCTVWSTARKCDRKFHWTESQDIPNVVQVTNQEGLFERFEDLQGRLTLCEKSLAEYLETKRLSFPRFYFVSQAYLLDILSNGNNPKIIATHLAKLFDNTTDLKFKELLKCRLSSYFNSIYFVWVIDWQLLIVLAKKIQIKRLIKSYLCSIVLLILECLFIFNDRIVDEHKSRHKATNLSTVKFHW